MTTRSPLQRCGRPGGRGGGIGAGGTGLGGGDELGGREQVWGEGSGLGRGDRFVSSGGGVGVGEKGRCGGRGEVWRTAPSPLQRCGWPGGEEEGLGIRERVWGRSKVPGGGEAGGSGLGKGGQTQHRGWLRPLLSSYFKDSPAPFPPCPLALLACPPPRPRLDTKTPCFRHTLPLPPRPAHAAAVVGVLPSAPCALRKPSPNPDPSPTPGQQHPPTLLSHPAAERPATAGCLLKRQCLLRGWPPLPASRKAHRVHLVPTRYPPANQFKAYH